MIDTDLTRFLIWCLAAFLSGSIPFGLLVVKAAGKGETRGEGTGEKAANPS